MEVNEEWVQIMLQTLLLLVPSENTEALYNSLDRRDRELTLKQVIMIIGSDANFTDYNYGCGWP